METMTYTETLPYKVADIGLSEFGRKEIVIAEKEMPAAESWAELIPLSAAPAPGNTPGSFLGETVRRVFTGGGADE